jgi:hypothetical protein
MNSWVNLSRLLSFYQNNVFCFFFLHFLVFDSVRSIEFDQDQCKLS